MKLHLPTRLRAAVLACITAVAALATTVGTGALTTGVVAYTIAASQAEAAALVNRTFDYEGVTFSGGALVTLDVTNAANVTAGGASHTLTGVDQMTVSIGSETMLMTASTNLLNSTGKGDSGTAYVLWQDFASNKCYYGQTIRLTGATEAWTTVFNYSPVTYGGVITDAASDDGAYTIGRYNGTATVEFYANEDAGANMLINATTTVAATAVSVKTSGTWALNKNLTLGAATTVDANKTITVTGTGALNISGALTLNAGSRIAAENNAIAVNGALSLNLDGITAGADAIISSAAAVSATGLTLSNYLTLEAGSYKLISTTNDAATALASLFENTERYSVSNKSGVVTLTVADVGMVTLDADIVAGNDTTAGNIHDYYASGLNVADHTISVTYTAAGFSTLYTKGLKGSGDITFNRTNGGNNLCVLWIDGDASEYTGTISMGSLSNAYLKVGSDAATTTDLSAATVDMTNEVLALGGESASIGTLNTNGTDIRAVDGLTSRISEMTAGTGMQSGWSGFVQKDDAARSLTLTKGGVLTGSTIRKGVSMIVGADASVTMVGGTVQGNITNNGELILSGAITLSNAINTSLNSGVNFATDVSLDLSQLTATDGVYHVLSGLGTSNLSTLTVANITGVTTAGYSWTFNDNGTITAVSSSSDLVWNVPAGTWDTTTTNWQSGSAAAAYTAGDNVTFGYADAVVTLAGNVTPTNMTVTENTTITGNGIISLYGTFSVAEGKTLTIDDSVAILADSAELATGLFDSAVAGTGVIKLATDLEYGYGENKAATAASGLSVDAGKTLSVGNDDHRTVSLASFSSVELNGTIKYQNKKDTLNNLSVASGVTGVIASTDMGNAADDYLTLAGTTTVDGTLRLSNWWNGKFAIDALTGNGTLRLTSMSGAGNVAENVNSSEAASVTIHDMSGFSGTIQMRNAKMTLAFDTSTSSNATVLFNANCGGTVQFSGEGNTYSLNQFNTSDADNYDRRIVVDSGVSVTAANLFNTWGMHSVTVNGEMNLTELRFATSANNSTENNLITGEGTINTEKFAIGHGGTYNVDIAHLNIGAGGMAAVSSNNCMLNLGTTEIGVTANWASACDRRITLVSTEGTTFNTQSGTRGNSATLNGVISGEGQLIKTGLGTLTLGGANTYEGGTTINGGTIVATATNALGTGAVTIAADGALDLKTGAILGATQAVASSGSVVLHDTLTAGVVTNSETGVIVIAPGFAGLESAGIVGIDGGAEGNGFKQGGSATVFSGDGSVTGNMKATFNGTELTIAPDGTVTLTDDFSTYHINNALLSTETFGAIKGAATAHSTDLVGIDFAVADQTLTIDADGFATSMVEGEQASTAKLAVNDGQTIIVDTTTLPTLQLAEGGSATLALQNSASATISGITGGSTLNVTGTSSADTLTFDNGNINRVLNITDATVAAGNVNGTGFNTQATNVNAGGVLRIENGDGLGWGDNAAGLITLAGTAEKVATLALGARQTLKTNIAMNGNSLITAISAGDHSSPMLDPYGGTLTVTGTNNTITTGVRQRDNWEVTVEADASLVFDGTELTTSSDRNGGIFKKGEGTMTFRNASGSLRKFTADGGVTVLDNTTFAVEGNMDLSHGNAAHGIVKLQNSSALNFANAVNLWVNNTTSLEVDETSSVNFTRTDWSMNITGATEGSPAVIAGTKDAYYNLNDAVVISDAIVTASATADKTVSTKLTNSAVVNNGSSTLTFSNSENTAYTSVDAHGGNITLSAATSIGSVTIAAGKTLTASAEGPLSISTALTAGAGSTLASALTIGNGAALDLVTGDSALSLGSNALTLGTGLTISEAMKSAIEALEADASLTLMKGVTSLTGGDIAATDVFTGLTGDYTIKVQDGNLVVNAAALPSAELTWEGSDGIWGEGTPWTGEGGASSYVEGATVTINGTTPGIITVKGAQTAKNVTVATTGYTIKRADTGTNSLTIQGNLIVNEDVTLNLGFMPTVNGSIVLNDNSVLDMSTAIPYIAADSGATGASFADMLAAVSGTGKVQMTGDVKVQLGGGSAASKTAQTFATDFSVDGMLKLQNWQNETTWTLAEGKTLDVTGDLWMSNKQTLALAAGSTVNADTLHLGMHEPGGEYKGILTSTDATINIGHFIIEGSNAETAVAINGGDVTITDTEAFAIAGVTEDAATVSVTGATIKTGTENDTVWNHASTLTNVTLAAAEDHSITVGGTGTTTLAGTLTNTGAAILDGTLDTTALTGVTNSGDLTITADSVSLAGLNNTGSVTAKDVTLTAATTAGGELSAGNVTLTGANTFDKLTATGTVTSADTLTVGDGSEMNAVSEGTKLTTTGDVTIKSAASLAELSNAGNTLTVDGALTLTGATTAGGTVSADSLSLTGANTFDAITTGALTIANSLNVTGELDATAVSISDVSLTTTALTAGSFAGTSLALTVDQQKIADAMGTSATTLTLANIAGLTAATINGTDSFKVGSRDYTIGVADGVVTITAEISDQFIWDATAEGSVWGDASSWEGNVQPTDTSNVVFNGTGMEDVTIAGNAVAGNIFVESETNFTTATTGNVATGGVEISKDTLTIDENVTVVATGTTSVVNETGNLVIKGALQTDTLAATGKDVQLSGTLTVDTEGAVNSIGGVGSDYGKLIVGTESMTMMLDLVADTLTIAADSTVDDLEVRNTGNLDAKGTFTVNNDADVAAGGVMTVAKDLTITGDLTNAGNITVGSETAPAKLTVGSVDNNGTITVYNTMEATDDVTNEAGATLDVTGNLTATGTDKTVTNNGDMSVGGIAEVSNLTTGAGSDTDIAGAATVTGAVDNSGDLTILGALNADKLTTQSGATTDAQAGAGITTALTNEGETTITGALAAATADVQNNAGTLTVTGATSADTLATAAGATTEAKGGATIGTSLDNHGTTTVTGNLVSADTTTMAPGSAIITNDATGTGEKLVVTGNVSGASLTTDTDATTEIGGTATLADGLTNNGTTTITGATTLGGTTENTGTLATGALTAETLNNEGTLNVTGNATVKDLSSATASSLTDVSGTLTIAEGGSLSDAGDITASALDLSNLAATDKATVGNLKTNAVTLNGLSSATTGLTVETLAAKTPGQKVTVSVADSIVDQLAALEENDTAQLVTVTDAASTGKLQLTAAAAGKIANELDKKLLTYTISDNGVLTVLDNSFDKDMTLSGNAQAGMDMTTEAYLAAGGTPTGALKDVTDALKTYRAEAASADPAVAAAATSAAERLTTALSGSSIAAMGSALSGDVERQLRAIRNRTTTMGVNQAVINEGMPYYNAWVNAEGDYRKVAADGTMAGYKMMSWGGTVGMDVDVTPSFTCGLAATAMYGDFDADSTDNATGDLNTYYVSAFARYAKHRWTHTFVATAGMADTSLERTIEGHKVKGDSTGVMFGGMYEVGYVFALDKEATTCLQPVLNVSFTHASLSGYDEDGANIGLSAGDTEFNKLTVGLGARLQSVVGENIYNRSSILEARAMVKFDAGDRQGETKVSFAGAGLPTHTVKSSETGAVGAEFGVGLTVPVGGEGGNLFMDASAEIRAEYTNVNATVGYRINF